MYSTRCPGYKLSLRCRATGPLFAGLARDAEALGDAVAFGGVFGHENEGGPEASRDHATLIVEEAHEVDRLEPGGVGRVGEVKAAFDLPDCQVAFEEGASLLGKALGRKEGTGGAPPPGRVG